MAQTHEEVVEAHRSAGRRFDVGGVGSFALDRGSGPAVVLFHGVPSSSFLYRKVIPPLADAGLRAVAFDFPGLGLADRPDEFDYSWSGLARFAGEAIDALGIERCHLVVHDIGGPIGCEWAIHNQERVLSLTALNTLLDVGTFHRPWSMRPFAIRGIGEIYLRSMTRLAFSKLFYLQGVKDRSATPRPEAYAYYDLLKREDGGRAFLRIMRGFELTAGKESFFRDGFAERPYPARVVWGSEDPALGEGRRLAVQEILRAHDPMLLPAKHFLCEDQAPAVANAIAGLAHQVG
ncbi:MAG TPA: alpha/beta fold hydrolase [Solirubrobacterales bacterium]|nr:alpha/beta fold hydrolase [Solirubrobacterales bacterium]